MKKYLQTNCKLSLLFTLAFMLSGMTGSAQTAYITNYGDNTVSVVDVTRNIVTATIKVGANPWAESVSPDGSTVYVANSGDGTVSVINTADNAVSATFYGGAFPFGIFVSSNGNLYVGDGNYINVINTFGYTIDTTIKVGSSPYGICMSSSQGKIYVANYGDTTVTVIDAAANTVSATIRVGANPNGVAVSPDGSKVYVANMDAGTVSIINTAADTVSATISVGGEPSGVCVSPDGTKAYIVNYDGWLDVINTLTNAVSATVYLWQTSFSQVGASVSPDGSKVYVADHGSDSVSVINSATNTVSTTIAVGLHPVAFGNFISGYTAPCAASFSIAADTSQLHHYIVTDQSFGKHPFKYQWSWGDASPDDTIQYPTHTYADSGFYNICLSITDSTGCQSTFCDNSFHAMRTTNTMVYITVFNPLLTGTQAINSSTTQVSIYPNPFTSQTTISFSEEQNNTTITITDLLGKEIKTIPHITGRQVVIDKGAMSYGIYFVRIMDEKGEVVNKKVVLNSR